MNRSNWICPNIDQRLPRELIFENPKKPVIQDTAPVILRFTAAWIFADSEAVGGIIRQVPEVVRLYPALQTEQIEAEEEHVLQDFTAQFNTVTDISFLVMAPDTSEFM